MTRSKQKRLETNRSPRRKTSSSGLAIHNFFTFHFQPRQFIQQPPKLLLMLRGKLEEKGRIRHQALKLKDDLLTRISLKLLQKYLYLLGGLSCGVRRRLAADYGGRGQPRPPMGQGKQAKEDEPGAGGPEDYEIFFLFHGFFFKKT